MSENHETHTGSCRCGQTRMEVTAPALITMACHCDGCRKMTASAFSLSAMVPAEAFSVVEGEPVKTFFIFIARCGDFGEGICLNTKEEGETTAEELSCLRRRARWLAFGQRKPAPP